MISDLGSVIRLANGYGKACAENGGNTDNNYCKGVKGFPKSKLI